jgi:hypothetical protein
VVELAAVLGSEVGFDEWAAVAEEGGVEADTALADGLQRLGLARRTPDGFAFAHRLLRESTLRLAADAGPPGALAPPVCPRPGPAAHHPRHG